MPNKFSALRSRRRGAKKPKQKPRLSGGVFVLRLYSAISVFALAANQSLG
jgi:hypothetical protein